MGSIVSGSSGSSRVGLVYGRSVFYDGVGVEDGRHEVVKACKTVARIVF